MQSYLKYITSVIFSLLLAIPSFGQHINFSHLTTNDGLSQFSVNSLYIDERGNLWIGTREGLNCYNGNDIQTFKLQKNDPSSLFCNNIIRIRGNQNGEIYLLCTEGIAEYNLRSQRFRTLLEGTVNGLYFDKQLYYTVHNRIYTLNTSTRESALFYELPYDYDIETLEQSGGSMWMGTNRGGLFRLNLRTRQLSNPIQNCHVTSIHEDSKFNLWVGTWDNGLYCVSPEGRVENFRNIPGNKNSISSNFVRTCCEDNMGNIWIGTFNGLDVYDPETKTFRNYAYNSSNRNSLTNSSVWCIVKDKQGTLWLGTYFGGVNYFNPEFEIYTKHSYSLQRGEGLSSPIVGRIVEDKRGNLWIATEGGGLNFYDTRTRSYKWYLPTSGANGISERNIKSLYYDPQKEVLWIGTHLCGLNRLDIRTEKFTHYRHAEGDDTTIPSDIVRDIIPYRQELIVATQNGVCLFSPESGKAQPLFKDVKGGDKIKMVADIMLDSSGRLWIAASGEGVFVYDFSKKTLRNYRHDPNKEGSISNNNVNYITEDSRGNLWFSTAGSGLDLYLPKSHTFRNYDHLSNGLTSDCIYQAMESPVTKRLVLITNNGISIFDPVTGKVENHNASNGFPITAINENGLYINKDGEIFLGGIDGMISFNEKELNFRSKPYCITFSKLIVNGREIRVDDDTRILKESLSEVKRITLNARQSMFSIEFATSNYIAANRDEIVYQLKGFSDDWNSTRGQHVITYTNLNAGTYRLTLKVKGKDEALYPAATLQIVILPPWYRTVWAYLFYIVSVTFIAFYLIRTYKMRVKLRESLRYEKKRAEDIESLNQSKLRFFTNISHEFRTPLTMIVAQIETLLQTQNFTPVIYNKVLSIYKNSIQLRELITELLDFRKQEQGHMKIKVSQHNIVSFLYENYLLFTEYAETKEIHFDFEKSEEDIEVWYDERQMQKVINNLVSNAIKYTEPEDTIRLKVCREGDYAVITVEDTGSGIRPDDIDKIFNRFYQIESENDGTKTGTGIGLALTKGIVELHHGQITVESEYGKGTAFVVKLLLGNSHFTADEISAKEEITHGIDWKKEKEEIIELDPEEVSPLSQHLDKKILIVEDNDSIREMLANIFRHFYEVITAKDGQEGWQMVQEQLPSLVLSDVVMPNMSGTELCKLIKGDFNTCHIPVVLLTARTAIEQNIEGLKIGADDYITKPFNTRLLISRCNNLVNSRIILQEKFSKQPQAYAQMLATNPIDKEILDRAIAVIEEHIDDTSFNVNVFAREMMMARTSLFTKLKAITGQTPNEFILTIRLKRGAVMLRNNPELNITEISDKIGFSSSRYFSKCFKNVYHVTPLNYRKGEDGSSDDETEEE